jgi:hypothetical protein
MLEGLSDKIMAKSGPANPRAHLMAVSARAKKEGFQENPLSTRGHAIQGLIGRISIAEYARARCGFAATPKSKTNSARIARIRSTAAKAALPVPPADGCLPFLSLRDLTGYCFESVCSFALTEVAANQWPAAEGDGGKPTLLRLKHRKCRREP